MSVRIAHSSRAAQDKYAITKAQLVSAFKESSSTDLFNAIKTVLNSPKVNVGDHFVNIDKAVNELQPLLRKFDINGYPDPNMYKPTAFWYNDYYKCTMTPVIRCVENALTGMGMGAYPCHVKFTVNIRDEGYRNRLCTDMGLREKVNASLKTLTERQFARDEFNYIKRNNTQMWTPYDETLIFGDRDRPRALAQAVECHEKVTNEAAAARMAEFISTRPDDVLVYTYIGTDNTASNEEKPMYFINAIGPWHKVTWLETTLMQATYRALLDDRLQVEETSYAQELVDAMHRCARSVEQANSGQLGNSAIFVGRRTMGMPLMLFQTVYCDKHLKNKLGTSSMSALKLLSDANITLSPDMKAAGTHAHELSMVLSAIFGDRIDDVCGCPVAQTIGHALYFLVTLNKKDKVPMPMLPDTFGTKAFVRLLKDIRLPSGGTLEDKITLARQDSGELIDFLQVLTDHDFVLNVMASEIESVADIEAAKKANNTMKLQGSSAGVSQFTTMGAGGFFGDSRKAHDSSRSNISMAVKATRVYVGGKETTHHPVKLGDAKGEAKFEIDRSLAKHVISEAKDRAMNFKNVKSESPTLTAEQKSMITAFIDHLYHRGSFRFYMYLDKSNQERAFGPTGAFLDHIFNSPSNAPIPHVFSIQESVERHTDFMCELMNQACRMKGIHDRSYVALHGRMSGPEGIAVIYDERAMGPAADISPLNSGKGVLGIAGRAFMTVHFKDRGTVLLNMHAPNPGPDKVKINTFLRDHGEEVQNVKVDNNNLQRALDKWLESPTNFMQTTPGVNAHTSFMICGDMNDASYKKQESRNRSIYENGFTIPFFLTPTGRGTYEPLKMKIVGNAGKPAITCCTFAKDKITRLPGDYIMLPETDSDVGGPLHIVGNSAFPPTNEYKEGTEINESYDEDTKAKMTNAEIDYARKAKYAVANDDPANGMYYYGTKDKDTRLLYSDHFAVVSRAYERTWASFNYSFQLADESMWSKPFPSEQFNTRTLLAHHDIDYKDMFPVAHTNSRA